MNTSLLLNTLFIKCYKCLASITPTAVYIRDDFYTTRYSSGFI